LKFAHAEIVRDSGL